MSSLLTFVKVEEDRFFGQYQRLWRMLATFHDPAGTDADMTQEYVQGCDASVLEEILADGQRFLGQRELPMRLIATNANRYLITEAEQRQWLQTLLDRVQAELEVRQGAPASTRV